MSSHIVEDETISRFLSVISAKAFDEQNTKLGRKLLAMNIKATEQRYPGNHFLTEVQKKKRLKDFEFNFTKVSKIQALKSLTCFLYQCSEGTVPKSKLYKEMREKENTLMYKIIDELPEYDKAEWG